MPISEGVYQCLTCDDSFNAKSDGFYSCSCGASEIKPSDFHYTGYSYKNGNTVNVIEGKTYSLPEEFITLNERSQKLYDEIKQIKADTNYKYNIFEMFEDGFNEGDKYLKTISISTTDSHSRYSSGSNTLDLSINLHSSKDLNKVNEIEERLERFLDFMKRIESGQLDLSKISEMQKLADEFDLDEYKEQVEEYDYKYYV